MMPKINIPDGAARIIDALAKAGFDAYVVGGCVRDSLLGLEPHDWDICTSALPPEILSCFSDRRVIETGIKHGTVTVVMDDGQYEVTTFRVDGAYSDHRHPDSVAFTADVKDDLARRDFTINAMAYNHFTGLVDPFGGQQALRDGVISCVGNPAERFGEDALRIMRALRFASTLGFYIEEATAGAIHGCASTLQGIAAERIYSELCKLLGGKNVLDVLLGYGDVMAAVIPELGPCIGFQQNNPYHEYTVYDHIAHAVANYKGNDPIVRLALLLHDIGKPLCYSKDEKGGHFHGHGVASHSLAADVAERLRLDTYTKESLLPLVLYHDSVIEPTPRTVRRWLNKLGAEQFERLLSIRMADILAHTKGTQESRIERCLALRTTMEEVLASEQCFSLKKLNINGHDVMALGVSEGKQVGDILQALLEEVMDGVLENEHEALVSRAEHLVKGGDAGAI